MLRSSIRQWEVLPVRHGLDPSSISALAGAGLTVPGGPGADSLEGTGSTDSISGFAGDDTLVGLAGNDTLDGGIGDDVMMGGAGGDRYYVDSLDDLVVEAPSEGWDTVYVSFYVYVLPENVETLISTAEDGGWYSGNRLDNIMFGTSHEDVLQGGAGNDTLRGGLGDDIYFVENDGDVVIEGIEAGYDMVFTGLATYSLTSNIEEIRATTITAHAFTGNALDNYLKGNRGADTLAGGGGRDGLDGGAGKDVLTGGQGTDYFQFRAPPTYRNVDTITDFNARAGEEIDLQSYGTAMFGALTQTGWLDETMFKVIGAGGAAVDSSDRILYRQSTGQLYYDPDGNGSLQAMPFAVLTNHPVLSAGIGGNFWVF